MLKLRSKVLILLLVLVPAGYYGYSFVSRVEHVTFDNSLDNQQSNKNIVIVHMEEAFSGAEVHDLYLYKGLLDKGYNVELLIPRDSGLAKECNRLRLPYHASNARCLYPIKALYKRLLIPQIRSLCVGHDKCVVQTYTEREAWAAKQVDLPIKLILTRHVPTPFKYEESLRDIDGVLAVSPYIEKSIRENKIKNTDVIVPLYDQQKFFGFKSDESTHDFFKREFGLKLQDLPIVCMVASMITRKNHDLLFESLSKLIHDIKRPVEVVLAGCGPEQRRLESLAKELKIDKYVHFLGFTNKVTQIVYHSDINVLPSKTEGCPISLLEAAALGKVSITSSGHGGDATIIHDKTGLIFKNGDENDFLAQLTKLLDNPELGLEMGKNAREHVKKNLSAQSTMNKVTEFIERIW